MRRLDLYARPELYDVLHDDDTASWCGFLRELSARHGTGGAGWLEPACGTGRFLRALPPLGVRVTGYDRSPAMLAYARRGLPPGAEALRGDLTSFLRPRAFDLAFCLLGSIRHLLDPRAAVRHLALTRRSLKPGGAYVVGLDLCDYARPEPDEEAWSARRGDLAVDDLVETLPAGRRDRRERVIHFLTVRRGNSPPRLYKSEYDLLSFDARQWRAAVRAAGLRIAAVYSPWREPARLDASVRDATFVLKAAR